MLCVSNPCLLVNDEVVGYVPNSISCNIIEPGSSMSGQEAVVIFRVYPTLGVGDRCGSISMIKRWSMRPLNSVVISCKSVEVISLSKCVLVDDISILFTADSEVEISFQGLLC
jgi:hypothetical protein